MHFLLSSAAGDRVGWIAGLTDDSGLDLGQACVWALTQIGDEAPYLIFWAKGHQQEAAMGQGQS